MSCYFETGCDNLPSPSDEDHHTAAYLPWIQCRCRKTFICQDCYHDARLEGNIICQLCDGTRHVIVGCSCSECGAEDFDMSASDTSFSDMLLLSCIPEGSEDVPFFSEKNKSDWFINTVDWTDRLILEELGIHPANKLGQLIVRLVDHAQTPPARVFETLETLLGDDPLTLHRLNSEPAVSTAELIPPVHKFVHHRRRIADIEIENNHGLDQLIEHLEKTVAVPRAQIFHLLEGLGTRLLRRLNQYPLSNSVKKRLQEITADSLRNDLVAGILLEVYILRDFLMLK